MNELVKTQLLAILEEEIEVAQGCTEPIAGAYTSAYATRILNQEVTKIEVVASQNIIKNAKGVIIPGTSDLMGIEASVILGMLIGDDSLKMEVLKNIDEAAILKTKQLLNSDFITLQKADSPAKLLMSVKVYSQNESAEAMIMHMHTNVVRVLKNDQIIESTACDESDFNSSLTSKQNLNLQNIYQFANIIDPDQLQIIKKQIEYNHEISIEGKTHQWGASVARVNKRQTIVEGLDFDISRNACAAAAAGSDARMSGCSLPVVTVNGSGNQGMTIANPLYEYAKYYNVDKEKHIRSVAFADLVAIRLKKGIGRLSPLCGATYAAIAAIAGKLYMLDYELDVIERMIKNTIANNTGVICDGAKASCALKIYSGLDTALLGAQLAINGISIPDGTGIIQQDIEQTIDDLKLISDAMDEVDKAVLNILMKKN